MSANRETPRVVFLTHVFPRMPDDPLGAFILHLAQGLAARGVEVTVVVPHAENLPTREMLGPIRVERFRYAPARWERLAYRGAMHQLVARGVSNWLLFAFFNLAFFIHTLIVIARVRPNILHAHWWAPAGVIGALVSVLTRVPLVITTHGTDVEQLRRARWARPLARFTCSCARAITCGSTFLRQILLDLHVADAARVGVIPMPVNPLFQSPPPSLVTRRSSLAVLTVARLSAQKSIDTLIEATSILRERGREARLIVIGDGEQRGALEQQARALNLHAHVEFLGMVAPKDLPRYYAACDVFVLPSIREGMGLVLVEALLCGAPVIATNSGGVTDIVQDGETGLLVPARDASALAAAVEKIARDHAFAARLADKGRAWVCERFAPDRVAAQFLETYRGAAGQF